MIRCMPADRPSHPFELSIQEVDDPVLLNSRRCIDRRPSSILLQRGIGNFDEQSTIGSTGMPIAKV